MDNINNNVVNTDSIVNNSYQVVLSLEEKVKCLEEILNKIKKRDGIQAINECRPLKEVIEENKNKEEK